jgi:transposase-like protein
MPGPSLKRIDGQGPSRAGDEDIRRQTRRHVSARDEIRIVLESLRGDDSIAALCRREDIARRTASG